MSKPMIGADPEVFVQRGKEIIPIFGLVGGTKDEPRQMFDMPRGYAYQEDNAALEFNIPACSRADTFASAIYSAKVWIINNLLSPQKLTLANTNRMTLTGMTMHDPRALTIGCDPDYHAYDDKLEGFKREALGVASLGNLRFGGGHIHVGYNKDKMPPHVAAQFLDLFLGLPCVKGDKQGERRSRYGLPGLYRPKPYGVEYRTLSNFWTFLSGDHINLLGQNALTFSSLVNDEKGFERLAKVYSAVPWNDVRNAISNEDEKLAALLLDWLGGSNGFRIYNIGSL